MFAFYDFETTGISPAFDQPLQFAAILVDDDFQEIERVNLRCRLSRHIIPSPYAMLVTGLEPDQLVDETLPSLFEFSQSLSQLIQRWTPAIWVGYNSINFDEMFLRHLLYQNLHADLYATQFNGNTRFDIMKAMQVIWLKQPDLFVWPQNDKGNLALRLDQLAPANGFAAHNAHDALGDVEATIYLAQRIAKANPTLWQALLNNRFRQQSLNHLTMFEPMEMIVRYGGQAPQSITGCYCGQVQGSNSMVGFFDLDAANPAEFYQDDDALLRAITDSPKIIRLVNLNAIPNLLIMDAPSDQNHKRAQFIADHTDFQTRIGTLLGERLKSMGEQGRANVEDKIYQGFYTTGDKRLLAQFQNATWSERYQMQSQFQDQRLQELGLRLIATNAPELLSDEQRQTFTSTWAKKWAIEDDAPWMTITRFHRELAEIEKEGFHDEQRIHDLKSFLTQCAEAPF